MKTLKITAILAVVPLFLISCATLNPVTYTGDPNLQDYQYAFINSTSQVSSNSGIVLGNQYGVYGGTDTKSVVPGDIIKGQMIKHGFTIVPQITPDIANKTLIINFGETGERKVTWGKITEIVLQFVRAGDNKVIYTVTSEGFGDTKADDIRIAIERAFKEIFNEQ